MTAFASAFTTNDGSGSVLNVPTPTAPEWFVSDGNPGKPGRYSFPVILMPESDGGWSVVSATIDGVASQGDTVDEALRNIVEAFEGVLAAYRDAGEKPARRAEPLRAEAHQLVRHVKVEVK